MVSFKQKREARKAAAAKRAGSAKPAAPENVVRLEPDPSDRDGLLWLLKKGKLGIQERRGCAAYRTAYREPPAGAIRSFLDDTRGGGDSGFPPDTNADALDAQRRLYTFRYSVLLGDTASILVMDAICGRGVTLAQYVGGSDSRKALEALTVLKTAARLIDQHLVASVQVKARA
jgi:hypothetical protein